MEFLENASFKVENMLAMRTDGCAKNVGGAEMKQRALRELYSRPCPPPQYAMRPQSISRSHVTPSRKPTENG